MATNADVQDLIEKMTQERQALLALLDGIDEERAEYQPPDQAGEEGWSVKEQLSHLAEMETRYRAWVERALAEESPDLSGTAVDPVAYPLEDAHDATVSQHVAELLDQRERTLAVIEGIVPSDYDRTASHQSFGTLSVLQWLRSYYRHDRMHRAQIEGREPDYKPNFANGEPDQRRRR